MSKSKDLTIYLADDEYTITDTNKIAPQPPYFKQGEKLLYHQLLNIYRMMELENLEYITMPETSDIAGFSTTYGILSDKTGNGKTITIIGLICSNPYTLTKRQFSIGKQDAGIYYNYKVVENTPEYGNCSLIVVPHTLVKQWTTALAKFTTLQYIVLDRVTDINDDNIKFPIILCSSNLLVTFSNHFANTRFARVVYDEADSIEFKLVTKVAPIITNFTWLVTFSINTLLNNKISRNMPYLKNIMLSTLKSTELLKQLVIRNSDENIAKSFTLPPYNLIQETFKNKIAHSVAQGLVDDEIMNLINNDCLSDAIRKLNIESINTTNFIHALLEKQYIELANLEIEKNAAIAKTYSSKRNKEQAIENILNKINKIHENINHIQTKIQEDIDTCNICFEDMNVPVAMPCCKQIFCFKCVTSAANLRSSCVGCASAYDIKNITILGSVNDNQNTNKKIQYTDKFGYIENYLSNLTINSKMAIFSSEDANLHSIKSLCNKLKITTYECKGSATHIMNIVEKIKNSIETSILLINSKYLGAGLCLEFLDTIVITAKLKPDLRTQVIGRAYRLGQTKTLNVIELLYENEI